MDLNEVQAFLGQDWKRVETLFRESIRSDVQLLDDTNQYIFRNEGKLLRPTLGLLMARACGQLTEESICVAVASELLHNATLLHDDVVDGSSQRRGVPTVASLLGGRSSVLIGDFWLVKTMMTMLKCESHSDQVANAFSQTLLNLAEGEMFQLEKAGEGDTTEQDYFRIIDCKTASLFQTTCLTAAISVDAPAAYQDAARQYGRSIGIAFQIKDDIMDYEERNVGKPVGIDLLERKITLPLLGVMNRMDPGQEKELRSLVQSIPEHPEDCGRVYKMVRDLGGIDYAVQRLEEYVEKAKDALKVLPESKEVDYLRQLADYCGYRTK